MTQEMIPLCSVGPQNLLRGGLLKLQEQVEEQMEGKRQLLPMTQCEYIQIFTKETIKKK